MTPTNRRHAIRGLPALVVSALVAGCAATSTEDPFAGSSPGQAGDDRVSFVIQNDDFRDATVYVSWNGLRNRVGTVTGKTNQTYRVRWRSQEIYLEVDFLGGGGLRSRSLLVSPGDRVEFQILLGNRTAVRKT